MVRASATKTTNIPPLEITSYTVHVNCCSRQRGHLLRHRTLVSGGPVPAQSFTHHIGLSLTEPTITHALILARTSCKKWNQ